MPARGEEGLLAQGERWLAILDQNMPAPVVLAAAPYQVFIGLGSNHFALSVDKGGGCAGRDGGDDGDDDRGEGQGSMEGRY